MTAGQRKRRGRRAKKILLVGVLILAAASIPLAVAHFRKPMPRQVAVSASVSTNLPSYPKAALTPVFQQPDSFNALLNVPAEQLEQVDIAVMNLLCADGLPGSENLNVTNCLATLDQWAAMVQYYTRERRNLFVTNPKEFDHSEAHFKMFMLVEVLQTLCGIHYNPAWKGVWATNESLELGYATYADSRNIFLHGLVEQQMGTCANLPVLYVAVGRRCGYPLYLVRARRHFFVRWDDGKGERMNCEGTNRGLVEPWRRPDDHYKKWPLPISDEELLRDQYFLHNMTQRQLLAEFILMRADAFGIHARRWDISWELIPYCNRIAPEFEHYRERMAEQLPNATAKLEQLTRNFPYVVMDVHAQLYDPVARSQALTAYDQQRFYLEELVKRLASPVAAPIIQPKG